jgi:CHAT domain-containing protein/Tfp pilus assembly protein PilF
MLRFLPGRAAAAVGPALWVAAVLWADPAAGPAPSGADADREALSELLAEGDRLDRAGRFAEGGARFREALAIAERLGDESRIADSLFGLGKTQWGSGDSAGALETHRRALEIRRRIGDREGEAKSLNNIGLACYSLSRYGDALENYRLALEVALPAPSPTLEGVVRMNVGLVYRYLGRYAEAQRWMEESLAIRRQTGDGRAIGQTLNALGLLARARGFYREALERYAEALPLRKAGGDPQGESQTRNGIGMVYLDQGQYEDAIGEFQAALEIAERIGYTAQIGFSNQNIGSALSWLGRDQEALRRYETAQEIWQRLGRRGDVARNLYNLGTLKLRMGAVEAARADLLRSLEVAREIGEPEAEALALEALGSVDLAAGDLPGALARFDGSLALALASEMPEREWQARAGRARALEGLGRGNEALDELRAGARRINDLRANVSTDAGKIGYLDTRRELFDDLVAALTGAGLVEEALEAAEASRARALADLLAQRELAAAPRDHEALEEVRSALEERESRPLPGETPPPPPGGDAGRGGDRIDRALARLEADNAQLASLVSIRSPRAGELRDAAACRGATLVEYHLTDRRLFVWVVPPSGPPREVAVEAGRERVASLVRELRRAIETADAAALRDPSRLEAALSALDRLLIEPVAAWLPRRADEPVILVPDGPLALLPFSALLDRRGRPLAERHTLSFAPAAAVLRFTEGRRGRGAGARGGRVLLVADPKPPEGAGLERLPGSREEGARIAAHFPDSQRVLLTGAGATEKAVKRLAGDREVLHFATHGLISDDRPLASSLLLAAGGGEDGYLRTDEVFALDLEADLAVLSGCSTGLGRLTGDGLVGLTRAFLYAGAPSVVVSLWDVSDRATAFLMDRFYAQLRAGRGKAAALRAAQLASRRRFGHAALWAAFVLVGEP